MNKQAQIFEKELLKKRKVADIMKKLINEKVKNLEKEKHHSKKMHQKNEKVAQKAKCEPSQTKKK